MSITRGFLLLFLFSSLNCNVYAQEEIKISLANDTKDEQQTKEQLQRLLASYDLKKWIVTKSILIDEKAIPHSHPVLTLSTRHLKDDELLLSTFVHEQMHWFVIQDQERLSAAIKSFNPCFQSACGISGRRRRRKIQLSSPFPLFIWNTGQTENCWENLLQNKS